MSNGESGYAQERCGLVNPWDKRASSGIPDLASGEPV